MSEHQLWTEPLSGWNDCICAEQHCSIGPYCMLVQMNGKDFSWGSLNTLCWAVGSISGSMAEEQENRYATGARRCS
jgi:CRM1 / Exportin repeat 3